MNRYISIIVAIFAFSLVGVTTVQAEWYLGADQVPTSHWYQLENYSIDATIPSFSDSGIKFYSGFKANDLFSLELEYNDQMQFGVGNLFQGNELWLTDQDSADLDSRALFLSGQGTFYIDEGKRLLVRGGLYNWDLKSNDQRLTTDEYLPRRGTDIFYSVGSYFDITESFGFSAEWERFEFENDDVDFISTELHFSF